MKLNKMINNNNKPIIINHKCKCGARPLTRWQLCSQSRSCYSGRKCRARPWWQLTLVAGVSPQPWWQGRDLGGVPVWGETLTLAAALLAVALLRSNTERRGNILKGRKDFQLKGKAIIWP